MLMFIMLVVVLTSFAQKRTIYIKVVPETQVKIATLESKDILKDRFTVTAQPSIINKVRQWQKNGFDRKEFWEVFSTLLDKPESIGATFSKVADMLIKHTENVSNTSVGKLAVAMFVWKLIGPSLVIYSIKLILLAWSLIFGIWWWRKNHVKHSLPLRTTVEKSFGWNGIIPGWRRKVIEKHILEPQKDHPEENVDTPGYGMSLILHIAFFVLMFLAILII